MAILCLLARDSDAVAVLPTVVVHDELRTRQLQEYCVVPGLTQQLYGISMQRRFELPPLEDLLARQEADVLGGIGG